MKKKKKRGRPAILKDPMRINVMLTQSLLKRVDAYAERYKLNRSSAIRRVITVGLSAMVPYYDNEPKAEDQ